MDGYRGPLRVLAAFVIVVVCSGIAAQTSRPGFFVTSVNPGKGANLGGLEGADRYCQALASAAGIGDRTWRAYLSTSDTVGKQGAPARERIGAGPWYNVKGVLIATDLAQLHGANNMTKETVLTEKGEMNKGKGDTPNQHDILTGSQASGRAIGPGGDTTCGNWTSENAGQAMVGHFDRQGRDHPEFGTSWNASHLTIGCSPWALASTGGAGQFYCFAAD